MLEGVFGLADLCKLTGNIVAITGFIYKCSRTVF